MKKKSYYFIIISILVSLFSIYINFDWLISYIMYPKPEFNFQINYVIALFILYLYGILVVKAIDPKMSSFKAVSLGIVMSISMLVLSSSLFLFIGIPLNIKTISLILAISFFLINYLVKNNQIFSLNSNDIYAVITMLTISTIVPHFMNNNFSYDSFQYLNYGIELGKVGSFNSPLISSHLVSAYALFTPILDAFSVMAHFLESNALINILFINFIVFIFSEAKENLQLITKIKKNYLIIPLLLVILLLSTGMIIYLGLWHLNNGPLMILLFIIAFLIAKIKEGKSNYLILLIIMTGTSLFTRIEMPLYMIFILFIFSMYDIPLKNKFILFASNFFILLVYYIGFFTRFNISNSADFLTSNKAVAILSMFILFGVYLVFKKRLPKTIICKERKILYIGLTLLLISLSLMNFHKMLINIDVLYKNLFVMIYWGIYVVPWIIFLFIYNSVVKKLSLKDEPLRPYIDISLTYLFFIFIIFLLRVYPLRVGSADSGNRLFAHVFPILVFIAYIKTAINIIAYPEFTLPKRRFNNKKTRR